MKPMIISVTAKVTQYEQSEGGFNGEALNNRVFLIIMMESFIIMSFNRTQ